MLSLSKPLSPDHASWYFQRDDYFLAEEGAWYGSLAADFDLSGPIQRSDFLYLLQGFDINGEKSKIESTFNYDETIETGASKNISTIQDKPFFLGYSEEIKNCTLSIQCRFENYSDLKSKPFKVAIK